MLRNGVPIAADTQTATCLYRIKQSLRICERGSYVLLIAPS